jgi:hypothetical protein
MDDPGGAWTNLLWRFPDPGFASQIPAVKEIFKEELAKLAGELPMSLEDALEALESRFNAAAPETLIDVLH